tara:strand:+ start:4041 stop:9971 length:5931 start_codon:yes stop_codon:yes gene_type:complete
MPLSRLDNFLKNARGNILYVSPSDLDATDSIENQGNSLARPFKTIQRALIEAARFSYQSGLDNDRFSKTTILLYPGEHIVDNRPGWIPDGSGSFKLRNGTTSSDFPSFSLNTNFDLTSDNNALYKLNSVHGGVILPRGTSLVGLDLRKTKIRPKYVPDPENVNIERSALFRVTGTCYTWQFSIFDGDPNATVFKDYTSNVYVPNFSHHKLTCFEYADGINDVKINDAFISNYDGGRTDLDMYYEKVGLAYGASSGRAIEPDYPDSGLDIQPKIDEFRIVGPKSGAIGISSIKAGDGVTATPEITVTLESALFGLDVDTPFKVSNVSNEEYNGQFVVSDILSTSAEGTTQFKYSVSNAPLNPLPTVTGSQVDLQSDSVTSASPYVFNISLRSVFGMCGMHADGSKSLGFKSMVVAQFTGIGLQKDKNAFVKYNTLSGEYKDSTFAGNANINEDSTAVFKPDYENYHIKASNDSVIQIVSCFAIGYAQHFVTESGGDLSVTNSNSNFGAKALVSRGFKGSSFGRDDVGYITHIIPPKELETSIGAIEFNAIDVEKTVVGVASTSRLYLYNQTNPANAPDSVIEGYRVGAKENDTLNVLIPDSTGTPTNYSARIVMPDTELSSTQNTFQKVHKVGRTSGINSITSNTITFDAPHNILSGETIRVVSEDAHLPDGLENNNIYYAITSGIGADQIKIAKTLNDSITGDAITINNKGGILRVQSRVSDKNAGDIGHPIQFDTAESQWYITVGTASTDNDIYSTLSTLGTASLGDATPRTFINRQPDTRNVIDTIYRARYVIPAGSGITSARPPVDGYILQDSSTVIGKTDAEVATYFSPTTVSINNVNEQRNFRFIAGANWSSNVANIITELPHNLKIGSEVEIKNIVSTNNPVGTANSGFNGKFNVTGITSAREFTVALESSAGPGAFTNDTSNRNTSLPTFTQSRTKGTYQVYRSQQVQKYAPGEQDGIYHLLIINNSNSPTVAPFSTDRYSQSIQQLYPQTNRDNPKSDPTQSVSFALPSPIGETAVNDPQNSLTRETLNAQIFDYNIGFGVTEVQSNGAGTGHTFFSTIDHGLNRVINIGIADSGAGYGNGSAGYLYNAKLVSAGAASTQGQNATARIQVNSSGNIVGAKIMDGGSAYAIGDSLEVVGVAITTGYSVGIVTVTSIHDNSGDIIELVNAKPETNHPYNTLYRITGITTGSSKEVQVSSASTIGGASGIGITNLASAVALNIGRTLDVSAFNYNQVTGVGVVTTTQSHGLRVNNKIKLAGVDQLLYQNDYIVKKSDTLNSFEINIGIGTTSPTPSGTIRVFPHGYSSSGGNIVIENENFGRQKTTYAGITTTISSTILTASTSNIDITNISNVDINIGDYLLIGEEIVRVKTTVTGNPVEVFRGVLGTKAVPHDINSVVKRVECRPVEFRRNSIIRASGHTFEYVGYGPGNYSTALPEKQDRDLSTQEALISQSLRFDGGVNVYTGMNDAGDFYVGNKKVSSATGQEEVFDAPIPTVTGEDISTSGVSVGFDVLTPLEASISRSLRVEGGPNGNIVSEFDGPVIFNEKITSTSSKGIESNSLFLQGDTTVSRKYTVGIATPSLSGNPGDAVFNANPTKGGYVGWIYTTENDWYRYGNVSLEKNLSVVVFDRVGIATTTPGDKVLKVGSGATEFSVSTSGAVGVGTSANEFQFRVEGDSHFSGNINSVKDINSVGDIHSVGNIQSVGVITAVQFNGDGSGLTNLTNDSLFTPVPIGIGTGISPNNLSRVGIGTTVPHFNLDVGSPGTGSTDLKVRNNSIFDGSIVANDVNISGILTASSYKLDSTSGEILAGIITASNINVGSAFTTFNNTTGFGTATPRAKVDIEGSVKFKTYSEYVEELDISGGNVNVDLSVAQSFTLTVDEAVTQFTLLNPPSGATAFSILITQNSTGYSVGIATFKNSGGTTIPVKFPAGGVLPIVTTTANKSDIYSFKTFDGGSTLFGVVGGQNFA